VTVAVATYGISCAIAISGALLPWPKALPGSGPTACVVAVRAATADRTVLLITHRPVNSADVDQVPRLADGRLEPGGSR
jgi:hypothetical protein